MSPRLVWVNGSCYRNLQTDEDLEKPGYYGDVPDEYEDEVIAEDEHEDCEASIETSDNGCYRLKMDVPRPFFAVIIGKKGSTKKRLDFRIYRKAPDQSFFPLNPGIH